MREEQVCKVEVRKDRNLKVSLICKIYFFILHHDIINLWLQMQVMRLICWFKLKNKFLDYHNLSGPNLKQGCISIENQSLGKKKKI